MGSSSPAQTSNWYELFTGNWLSRPIRAVLVGALALPFVIWPRNQPQNSNPRLLAFFVYLLHLASIPWLYLVTKLVPEPYLVSLPHVGRWQRLIYDRMRSFTYRRRRSTARVGF